MYLTGARFRDVDLTNARFHLVDLTEVMIRGAAVDVDISGEIENLRVNGIDVVPLVEAECNRRYPDRVKMRPTDADGFREARRAILEEPSPGTRWTFPTTRCPTSPASPATAERGRRSVRCSCCARTAWPRCAR